MLPMRSKARFFCTAGKGEIFAESNSVQIHFFSGKNLDWGNYFLFQTWMNLWPHKKGPYDPLTYDVRRTVSVRIMLHGPWLEMRFPKRNMPLRRMHDDLEPTNVDFHEHVEVMYSVSQNKCFLLKAYNFLAFKRGEVM